MAEKSEPTKCSSCGTPLVGRGGASFPCPACGEQPIGRCPRCRDQSIHFRCPTCAFEGP